MFNTYGDFYYVISYNIGHLAIVILAKYLVSYK